MPSAAAVGRWPVVLGDVIFFAIQNRRCTSFAIFTNGGAHRLDRDNEIALRRWVVFMLDLLQALLCIRQAPQLVVSVAHNRFPPSIFFKVASTIANRSSIVSAR